MCGLCKPYYVEHVKWRICVLHHKTRNFGLEVISNFIVSFLHSFSPLKDGVASPEDIDKVMTDGLGLRYSLIGPFETIHLNANGEDGINIC